MTLLAIGQKVWLKPSAKRYHGGAAIIRHIDQRPKVSKRYFVERVKEAGQGMKRLWVARGEFDVRH